MAEAGSSAALPLLGRVAIVTGASRGIGRAIAAHLASLGARIVVNYAASSAQAELLVSEINASSSSPPSLPRAIAVRADVSKADEVKSLFDAAEAAFGGPAHVLVACAGVLDAKYPPLAATTEEDWDATFAVNAKGAFLCCREAANRLVRGGGGRIIAITSSLVASLRPGFAAYAASKAAVEAMVKILAKELRGMGVTANCVRGAGAGGDRHVLRRKERGGRQEECGGDPAGAAGGARGHRPPWWGSWPPTPASGSTGRSSAPTAATCEKCTGGPCMFFIFYGFPWKVRSFA